MATLDDVRNTAAGLLGRHRIGQAINNDIKTRLDRAYTEVYADLKDKRLSVWSSAANTTIPDGVSPHVSALMAFNAMSDIGVSAEREQRILMKYQMAMPAIKRYVTPDYESLQGPENF